MRFYHLPQILVKCFQANILITIQNMHGGCAQLLCKWWVDYAAVIHSQAPPHPTMAGLLGPQVSGLKRPPRKREESDIGGYMLSACTTGSAFHSSSDSVLSITH